jgi:hypothetical protein
MGRSDAFEQGIGGFDLRSGRAFRLLIPPELQHRKSQNFLEYIACMTQLVCLLVESDWQPGDSFLSIGDNSSAIGWIKKLNFKPEEEAEQATHLALARYMTRTLSDLDVIQFGQWLPGADNGVADALSRQHDLSDLEVTDAMKTSFPSQTPNGFHIKALPPEITSWAIYWMRHDQGTRELPPELQLKAKRGGTDGSSSSTTANSKTTSFYGSSHPMNATCSSVHSHSPHKTASGPNPLKDMTTWLQEHAAPQSMQYARPSSQPVGTIPGQIQTENLRSFYNAN